MVVVASYTGGVELEVGNGVGELWCVGVVGHCGRVVADVGDRNTGVVVIMYGGGVEVVTYVILG